MKGRRRLELQNSTFPWYVYVYIYIYVYDYIYDYLLFTFSRCDVMLLCTAGVLFHVNCCIKYMRCFSNIYHIYILWPPQYTSLKKSDVLTSISPLLSLLLPLLIMKYACLFTHICRQSAPRRGRGRPPPIS